MISKERSRRRPSPIVLGVAVLALVLVGGICGFVASGPGDVNAATASTEALTTTVKTETVLSEDSSQHVPACPTPSSAEQIARSQGPGFLDPDERDVWKGTADQRGILHWAGRR